MAGGSGIAGLMSILARASAEGHFARHPGHVFFGVRTAADLFFADELAYWVGETPEVSAIPDGTQFGVSLSDVGRTSLDAEPVIVGEL